MVNFKYHRDRGTCRTKKQIDYSILFYSPITAVITPYHGHGKNVPWIANYTPPSCWYTLPVAYFPILLSSCLAILFTGMTALITLIKDENFALADTDPWGLDEIQHAERGKPQTLSCCLSMVSSCGLSITER
jgi:hypothetical protein